MNKAAQVAATAAAVVLLAGLAGLPALPGSPFYTAALALGLAAALFGLAAYGESVKPKG